jgi:hypothetical protein
MRLNRRISFLVFFFIPVFSVAQSTDTLQDKHITYYNQFLTGALFLKGGKVITLSASTYHGIRYDRLAIGLGISYDTYSNWKGLPFLVSVAYDIAAIKENYLFLQLDAGSGGAWPLYNEGDFYAYEKKRGTLIHPAIGYRLIKDGWSLYIKGGYKFHRIRYDVYARWWGSPGNVSHVTQDMERISLQLGFGLH